MGQDLNTIKNPSAENLGFKEGMSAIANTLKFKQLSSAKEQQGFLIYDYLKWKYRE